MPAPNMFIKCHIYATCPNYFMYQYICHICTHRHQPCDQECLSYTMMVQRCQQWCYGLIVSAELIIGQISQKVHYWLSSGENYYSPTYLRDSTIFFILLNIVCNEIKNKVLPPYVNYPCHKVANYKNFHSLFFNFWHFVQAHFWQLKKNWRNYTVIFDILQLDWTIGNLG